MPNYPKRVVEGKSAPLTNEIWLDTNINPPVLKTHLNGEWVPVAGSSSDGEEGEGGETPPSLGFPFFLGKPVGFICWNDMNWDGNHLYASEDAILPFDGILPYCEAQDDVEDWAHLSFCPVIEYEEKYDMESDKFVDNPPKYLGLINVSYLSSQEPHWQLLTTYECNACPALYIGDKKYSVQMYIGD